MVNLPNRRAIRYRRVSLPLLRIIQGFKGPQKALDDILFRDDAHQFPAVAIKDREATKAISVKFVDGVNQGFIGK